MRSIRTIGALGITASALVALVAFAACAPTDAPTAARGVQAAPRSLTGNGMPSGAHYTLNIIGVPKAKTVSGDSTSGHVIFVPLSGSTKILLSAGDFRVLDANGTDGSAAFQLPADTTYSVFARPLGTPGGSATVRTCASDTTGTLVCSTGSTVQVRAKGRPQGTDVSKALLELCTDYLTPGTVTCYALFDPALEGYFWQYDNSGLRVLQLRFYAKS